MKQRVYRFSCGFLLAAGVLLSLPTQAQRTYSTTTTLPGYPVIADTLLVDSAFVVEAVPNVPTVPAELIRERLRRLERQIPLP